MNMVPLIKAQCKPVKEALSAISVSPDWREVTELPQEAKEMLREEVRIMTDGVQHYYLVKDNRVVYMGNIDREGLKDTLIKDLTTLPVFTNFMIAVVMDDDAYIAEVFEKHTAEFINQFLLGFLYFMENHGNRKVS